LADVLEPVVSGPMGPMPLEGAPSDSHFPGVTDRSGDGEVVRLRPSAIAGRGLLQRAVKRGIDIVGSLVLILAVLPVALIVALAIAMDSRGPIMFVQRRVGRNGVEFPLLKFRTMVRYAEGALADHIASDEERLREWQQVRKLRDDPRITRVGSFLRRFSIDELPQVLNVLRGDMSLVGPRPVLQDEVTLFGERARQILSIRPGLTGLWAVSGRSSVAYEERIELEFRYAVGWSLWMDAKILLSTIPAVVRGHGAY
jgi:exopolysaccharide production protein ExoY